jgi:hypothetical protein
MLAEGSRVHTYNTTSAVLLSAVRNIKPTRTIFSVFTQLIDLVGSSVVQNYIHTARLNRKDRIYRKQCRIYCKIKRPPVT